MTDRERLVETMARHPRMQQLSTGKTPLTEVADAALAALEAAGYAWYRPEDTLYSTFEDQKVQPCWCVKHGCPAERHADGSGMCWWELSVEAGGNHDFGDFVPVDLVPVGGDS